MRPACQASYAARTPSPLGRVAGPAWAVVTGQLVAIPVVSVLVLLELGRVLDLLLRPVHPHCLGLRVDSVDDPGRQHDLLAEDPRARVDDDVAGPDIVRRLVDLPDRAVRRLDRVAGEVCGSPCRLAVRPQVSSGHIN